MWQYFAMCGRSRCRLRRIVFLLAASVLCLSLCLIYSWYDDCTDEDFTSLHASATASAVEKFSAVPKLKREQLDIHTLAEPSDIPNENRTFVVYVHSAAGQDSSRQLIRRTWGNPRYYSNVLDFRVHVFFVVGVPLPSSSPLSGTGLEALYEESRQFKDLLMGNFSDFYDNLVFKGLTAMNWIARNLPEVRFILKCDDDVIVNTFAWMEEARLLAAEGREKDTILCHYWDNSPVQRTGRYRVSDSEYPLPLYPRFCSGSGYLMTREVVANILLGVPQTPFLNRDDVFFTGLVAYHMKIRKCHGGQRSSGFWFIGECGWCWSSRGERVSFDVPPSRFLLIHPATIYRHEEVKRFWEEVVAEPA